MDEAIQPLEGETGARQVVKPEVALREGQEFVAGAAQASRARHEARRAEVRAICRRRFAARKLAMRFVDVDFDPGGRAATIFFASDEKVDFREVFRDLCRDLRMRVTLHRLGPRDLAKRSGTCGPCGRTLCCKGFLAGFPSVSVRMVKEQKFPLTPDRSAGMCGRLKCCLAFEANGRAPRRAECGGCCLPTVDTGNVQGEPPISGT